MAALTLEKLRELFSSVAVNKEPEKPVDCTEYNWKKPHHYNQDHQESLNEFANLTAKNISINFSEICHCQMKSEVKELDQHYSGILIEEDITEQGDMFLRFTSDKKIAGFLRVPLKTAMAWVVHMLGDNEIDPNKKNSLSMLEESLLLDICKNVISALSDSLVAREAKPVESEDNLVKDKLTLAINPMQQLYEIAFNVNSPENVISDASLYICCEHIDAIAGKTVGDIKEADASKIDAARQNNLGMMYLPVTAELGKINISLSDLVSLQSGDVIKLDKNLHSSLTVKVKDKPAFKAWPVQNSGKYSLLIDDTKVI